MRIGKRFTFEAAHQLPNHDGKCARPHGHSYILEVVIEGEPEYQHGHPKQGMVLDFSDLGKVVREKIIDRLDHQDLNVVLADEMTVTTAENIAAWAYAQLSVGLGTPFGGVTVRVWETATSWAEYP